MKYAFFAVLFATAPFGCGASGEVKGGVAGDSFVWAHSEESSIYGVGKEWTRSITSSNQAPVRYSYRDCDVYPFADGSGVRLAISGKKKGSQVPLAQFIAVTLNEKGEVKKNITATFSGNGDSSSPPARFIEQAGDMFEALCKPMAQKLPELVKQTFHGAYGLGEPPKK